MLLIKVDLNFSCSKTAQKTDKPQHPSRERLKVCPSIAFEGQWIVSNNNEGIYIQKQLGMLMGVSNNDKMSMIAFGEAGTKTAMLVW